MNAQLTTAIYNAMPGLVAEYSATEHEGKSLLELIEHNLTHRHVSSQQMSDTLKTMARERRVSLSDEACHFLHFPELLLLYYEMRDSGTLLAAQAAFIQEKTKPKRGGARPGAGRKAVHPEGRTVPLGVNYVAPDVARLVAAAAQPTAYVEAAIRHYAARPLE